MEWPSGNHLTRLVAIKRLTRPVALFAAAISMSVPSLALTTADLQKAADRVNTRLPRMVAPSLRQERATVTGMELTHLYTHTELTWAQLQPMRLSVTQRPYIFPRICTESYTGRMLREGVTIHYVYRGVDGGLAGEVFIRPADCNGR